jgi:prepilin-type N-terminal cleavage/methylation domain-containing protein
VARPGRGADDGGFSMIELMVSLSIFAVVVAGVATAMDAALDLVRHNRQRSTTSANQGSLIVTVADRTGAALTGVSVRRAANGTLATGYLKGYNYDPRLKYEGPPSFVDPVGKPWKVKAFAEVANPTACTSTRISLCTPP